MDASTTSSRREKKGHGSAKKVEIMVAETKAKAQAIPQSSVGVKSSSSVGNSSINRRRAISDEAVVTAAATDDEKNSAFEFCRANQPDKLMACLENSEGKDINEKNEEGDTLLHVASALGHRICVAVLLDDTDRFLFSAKGNVIDVLAWNSKCKTALALAKENGNAHIIDMLSKYPLRPLCRLKLAENL